MSASFDTMLARGVGRVYARFGEPAMHTDTQGVSRPVTVVVERSLAQYGQVAAVQGKSAVLNVRLSELPNRPRRGETFTLASGEALTVDSVLSSDGIEHKVVAA